MRKPSTPATCKYYIEGVIITSDEDTYISMGDRKLEGHGSGPEGAPAIQDVAPTLMAMMGLKVPEEMTGRVLV